MRYPVQVRVPMFGSLYAAGYPPKEILAFARKEKNLIRVLNLRLPHKGFVAHKFLRNQLRRFLPGNTFDDLKLPLYITVANITLVFRKFFFRLD